MYVVVYGEKQRAIYAHRRGERLAFPSHDEAPSSALKNPLLYTERNRGVCIWRDGGRKDFQRKRKTI